MFLGVSIQTNKTCKNCVLTDLFARNIYINNRVNQNQLRHNEKSPELLLQG